MEPADYTEAKKQAATGLLSGAQQYDKALLTLAAGALGLSITFIKTIAPQPAPSTLWLLGLSWASFILALLSTLVSFQTSIYAFRRQDKILDLLYSSEETDRDKLKNHCVTATLLFNYVSLACFIIGTVLLASFSYVNLMN